MRRTYPVRVGEVWDDFLASAPTIAMKIAQAKVQDHWAAVAGPMAARFTSSISVKNGVMQVHVTSAVLRNELFMRRMALRDALNAAVGAEVVKTLIIK